MKRPRVLAVDFGARRTGLAATDFTGTIVVPLEPLVGLEVAECVREIAAIGAERQSEAIVVGLPLDAEGHVGHHAERVMLFVAALQAAAPCPVVTVDETFSTDEAHDRLKDLGLKAARRKKVADSVAALVILERYLSESCQ